MLVHSGGVDFDDVFSVVLGVDDVVVVIKIASCVVVARCLQFGLSCLVVSSSSTTKDLVVFWKMD